MLSSFGFCFLSCLLAGVAYGESLAEFESGVGDQGMVMVRGGVIEYSLGKH